MIGWNSSPAVLKEDLNRMMCTDVNAISSLKVWLSQPGLKRPSELNYYDDMQLLKLLINIIQDEQVFCAQQAQSILRTFSNLLGQ